MKSFKAGTFFRIVLFLLCLSTVAFAQKAASSESDLKKQADRYFESDDFDDALVPYSQLLSLYPQDAVYNYRYGICLIIAGKEKNNAANFLQKASADPATPPEVWYYLAKAYMVIGKFSDAQNALMKFNQLAPVAKQKKLESDVLLTNCNNAVEFLKYKKNVVILESRDLARNEFSHFYDWTLANGRYVPAADQFLTSQDKDKVENPVMFITNDKQTIYMSSYGKNSAGGKDIYLIRKMTNGQWAQPENLGSPVNTSANEDFPYLDRDGRTLYFCSKGDKSIGGYDIFKSTFDFNSGKWSEPENLGWPINTIGDDYLFVPVNKGREAFYATTIESDKKSISIRKIQLPDQNSNLVTINGLYFPQDQRVRRDARISILQGNGQGLVTSVYSDPQTGKYEVDLEPGKDYVIVVEGGGYLPHAESFSIPSGLNNPDLRQVVKLNRAKDNESMILENYFYPVDLASTQTPSDIVAADYSATTDSSSMMVVKIDNKEILVTKPGSGQKDNSLAQTDADSSDSNIIRIEKDEYDPTLEKNLSKDDIRQKDEETKRAQELAEDEKAPKYDVTISNEELASIAANDAKTARAESDSLKKEVARLNSTADEKSNLADSYVNKALKADDTEKLVFQNKAYELRTESDNLRNQANDLQIAATAKENEALSSEQDAKALMQSIDAQTLADNKKGGKKAGAGNKANTQKENKNTNPTQSQSESGNEHPANNNNAQLSDKTDTQVSAQNNSPSPKSTTESTTLSPDSKSTDNINQNKVTKSDEIKPVSETAVNSHKDAEQQKAASDLKSDNQTNDLALNSDHTNSTTEQKTEAGKENSSDKKSNSVIDSETNKNALENSSTKASSNPDQALSENAKSEKQSTSSEKQSSGTNSKNVGENQPEGANSAVAVDDNKPSLEKNQAEQSNSTVSQSKNDSTVGNNSPVAGKESNANLSNNQSTAENSPVAEGSKNVDNSSSQPSTSDRATEAQTPVAGKDQSSVDNSPKPASETPSNASGNSTDQKASSQNSTPSTKGPDDNSSSKLNSSESLAVVTPGNDSQKSSQSRQNTSTPKSSVGSNSEQENKSNSTDDSKTSSSEKSAVKEDKSNSSATPAGGNGDVLARQNADNATSTKVNDSPSSDVGVNTPDSVYQSKAELKQFELPPVTEARPSMPADINARKAQPVKEEARLAYQEYKRKYSTSQRLAEQSVDLQKRIAVTPVSPERDSLIFVSNDLSQQSADMWKESVAQLNAAKQIDPDVKEKMELNEQIVAYNSSLPVSNANDRATKPENNSTNQITPANSGTTEQTPATVTENSVQNTDKETAVNQIPSVAATPQEKDETVAMVNTPPVVTEEVVLTPPLTEEEAKQVEEVTNFAVETPNGTEKIKISTEGLDTRHPDFPAYVELNKEITHKQVETITVFAEAVNLNKKAVDEKQEQGRLMDLAETQTDIQKKAKIFVQADSMKALSEADMKLAEEKFKIAQSKTGDVKNVTAQMEEVKSRIAIPGAKVSAQSTASVVHPEQQQTEIASDYAEAQKQEAVPLKQEAPAISTSGEPNNQVAVQNTTPSNQSGLPATAAPVEVQNANNSSNQSNVSSPAISSSSEQPTNSVAPQSGSVTASVTPEEKEAFSKNSFSIADKPVYSEKNPIPMNPQLPEGLVFKVQIGAFHNQIPAEKFNGVQPITGETTRPGWIRYCVGLFQTFEPANIVKKEMQNRGFKDAFVVAYFNGKRIELNEAYAMLTKGSDKLGKDYVATSRKEMALLRANDIRPEKIASVRKGEVGQDEKSFYGNDAAKEMNTIAAVEYAVQVGVYRSSTAPRVLAPLMPLLTEQIKANLYRFTTDHFSDYATADSMKRVARRSGVKDAFIVVYRNGAMATLASVPVSERRNVSPTTSATVTNNSTDAPSVTNAPSNSINQAVSASSAGLVFRVQLGAFKNNIPFTSVVAFLQVADKGITQQTDERGLHIFYAGDCKDYQTAMNLKAEITAKGITDAFVVALRDGKRVGITEDMK